MDLSRRTRSSKQPSAEPVDADPSSIFCSYARVDRPTVDGLVDALKARHVRVWVDTADIPPAVTWMDEIEQAIDAASSFILVLSPSYVASETCRAEAGRARSSGKIVVPVLIEAVEDLGELEWMRVINWIDATSDANEAVADAVLRASTTDPAWAQQHRELLLRAREWERSGRGRAKLLRGRPVGEAERALLAQRQPGDPLPVEVQREFVESSRRSQQRTRRFVTGAIATTAVVSLGLAAIALQQRNRAQASETVAVEQRNLAEQLEAVAVEQRNLAEQLEDEAVEQRDLARGLQATAEGRLLAQASFDESDPVVSAVLASEAIFRTDTPTVEAVEAWLSASRRLATDPLRRVARVQVAGTDAPVLLSPSGEHVVVGDDTTWSILDTAGGLVGAPFVTESLPLWRPGGDGVAAATSTGLVLFGVDGSTTELDDAADGAPMSWSPDGRLLVTRRMSDDEYVAEFPIVDVDRGGIDVATLPVGFGVPTFAWDSTGRYLVYTDSEAIGDQGVRRFVVMIDLVAARVTDIDYPFDVDLTGASAIICCGYDDQPELLLGTSGGALFVMNAAEWWVDTSEVQQYGFEHSVFDGSVELLEASPDGRRVAIGGSDGALAFYSPWEGSTVAVQGDDRSAVTQGAWDPAGNIFLAARSDGSLAMSDSAGSPIGSIVGSSPQRAFRGVVWRVDGQVVVVDAAGAAVEYRFDPTEGMTDLGAATEVSAVSWSPSGDHLAVGTVSGVVEILDSSGRSTGVTYRPDEIGLLDSSVWRLSWSPDESWIGVTQQNGGLAVLGRDGLSWSSVLQYIWTGPSDLSWAPDSSYLVLRDGDSLAIRVHLDGSVDPVDEAAFDRWFETGESGEVSNVWAGPGGIVVTLSFDGLVTVLGPDGSVLREESVEEYSSGQGGTSAPVALLESGQITIVNTDPTVDPVVLIDPSSPWVTTSWSPSGERLAVSDLGRQLVVYDAAGEEQFRYESERSSEIAGLSWGPDDNAVLVRFSDASSAIVSVDGENKVRVVDLGNPAAEQVVWSPSGFDIAYVSSSGDLWIERIPDPRDMCRSAVALVDIDAFRERLGRITTVESCAIPSALPTPALW